MTFLRIGWRPRAEGAFDQGFEGVGVGWPLAGPQGLAPAGPHGLPPGWSGALGPQGLCAACAICVGL
jgi:hypothetical protein